MCTTFGPLGDFEIADVVDPVPASDEAVVAVQAAGVNFRDLLSVQNKYQITPKLPFCPGCEFAGVVTKIGDTVSRVGVGDRVCGFATWGAFAEQVKTRARFLSPLPSGMSFPEAAGLTIAYGTADHALRNRARLTAGETLLVFGGGGGAGLAAVEVGKALGAIVIACTSSLHKLQCLEKRGADVVLNTASPSWRDDLTAVSHARGIDVVYDTLGGDWSELALKSLNWHGRLLVVGYVAGAIPRLATNFALLKEAAILGIWWGELIRRSPADFSESTAQVRQWYKEGKLSPLVGLTVPLAEIQAALTAMQTKTLVGKAVLLIQPQDNCTVGRRGEFGSEN